MNEFKVVVYGASVSAQSKHDSYWKHLSRKIWEYNLKIADSNHTINLSRLVYPSSHVSDAGLANLDILVSLDPDIVVMEWLSTDESTPCIESLNYIYEALTSRGIKVLTVALPRLDSLCNPTESYLYTKKLCGFFRQPFLDVISYCNSSSLVWSDVTRDGVHTNNYGGELYSTLLFNSLLEITDSPLAGQLASCSEIPAKSNLEFSNADNLRIRHLGSLSIGQEIKIKSGNKMILGIDVTSAKDSDDYQTISVLCKQSVGPFSRQCIARIGDVVGQVCLYDQWCYFSRFAYKPLMVLQGIQQGPHELCITTSSEDPECLFSIFKPDADSRQKLSTCQVEPPSLRLHDRLVSINCSITSLKIL